MNTYAYLARFNTTWVPETPVEQVRFVVLDSETTGLDPRRDRLITIGAVALIDGDILLDDAFEVMCKLDYNRASVTVHGITRDETRDALEEPAALARFLDYLKDGVIVGHHIGHDIQALNVACQRHGGFELRNQSLDTMDLALHLNDDGAFQTLSMADGFSLDSLCEMFNIPPPRSPYRRGRRLHYRADLSTPAARGAARRTHYARLAHRPLPAERKLRVATDIIWKQMTRRTFLAAATLAQAPAPFEAAAARRNITPDPLLPITGGMGPGAPARAKKGDLFARALVFRAGPELLAIVSVDSLGFPSVLGDRARALIKGIAPDRVLIGATHTHSAPDCYALPDGKGGHTGSLPYMQFVAEQIAAAVNEAFSHLESAELRVGSGEAKGKIAYNYYAPDLYDRRVGVLQARTLAGKAIGTLVNYAIHPEVLGSDVGLLSPDMVGPLCDEIEKSFGGMALFMNGAQGGMITADNRDLQKPPRDAIRAYWPDDRIWSECERIGGLLASESLRVITPAAWQARPALSVHSRMVRFRVESDDMWQVVQHSPLKYPHQASDRTVAARVNLVNLGPAQILTIPGEALPNIGFFLKRKMRGEHNLLFGLTNDAFGYILTQVDFNSFPAYKYISRVSLGEMTGEVYMKAALELIDNSGR